jgi:selenide,water dikinase
VLDEDGYAQMIATTTRLNKVGPALATLPGVHALTDVTGFGLLGHLLELCRGAGLGATVQAGALPVMPAAIPFAKQGIGPGAIARNLASCGDAVQFDTAVDEWQRSVTADAQTSGGLLVACAADSVEQVLACFRAGGFDAAAVVGRMHAGPAQVRVQA